MTNPADKSGSTRRETLLSLGRYAILGGLGLSLAHLILREKGSPADTVCTGNFRCSRCGAIDDCYLPEAVAARRTFNRPRPPTGA